MLKRAVKYVRLHRTHRQDYSKDCDVIMIHFIILTILTGQMTNNAVVELFNGSLYGVDTELVICNSA